VKPNREPITIDRLLATYPERRKQIRIATSRIQWRLADSLGRALVGRDGVLHFHPPVRQPKMGLRSVEALRPLLQSGAQQEMTQALIAAGAHRFPNARPAYVVVTRDYLRESFSMRLRERLVSFRDPIERRDWLANEPRVKGLGYKEASHFPTKRRV